ncbi:PASTA domain-containing protein [Salipaludibacillus sp. HK11]|uniref:PASTA domain-containing protein n=1 Tax=Salipaludibacillus sp. HK11 TaxID=3394320 RepID=UPI0039FBA396
MSDFLSKFNKNKYNELLDENSKDNPEKEKQTEVKPEKKSDELTDSTEGKHAPETEKKITSEKTISSSSGSRRKDSEEELEIDPTYQKRKRRKILIIIIGAILAFIVIFFIYYTSVHADVEDFVDHPVSDARAWANMNDVEIELTEENSMEYEPNQIISQSVTAGEKIRKGTTIKLITSLGPDPDEVISLPDFSEMNQYEAENWIEESKAENLQIVTEYSSEVEEGDFLRLTIRDTGIDQSEYRRRDNAAVYYSRGEEVYEKDISVPDFTGELKAEVEQWAATNEIEVSYEEKDSNTVELGSIISQSILPEEMIAKKDEMDIVVSKGKANEVPNFSELTIEEASGYPEFAVTVKQRYHSDVKYGGLISQSVEAGTKLTENDDTNITVIYSEGRPYLGDYRGQLEGDLPRLFYDEFQSKGADIDYIVKYVDAPEVKGTVVSMSQFNEFVSMTYTVEMRISKNTSAEPNPQQDFGDGDELEPIEEDDLISNEK